MYNPTRTRRRRKARRAARTPELTKPDAAEAPDLLHVEATTAAAPPPPPPGPKTDLSDLTRKEIVAQLDELGAKYSKRASRSALASQLWSALMMGA